MFFFPFFSGTGIEAAVAKEFNFDADVLKAEKWRDEDTAFRDIVMEMYEEEEEDSIKSSERTSLVKTLLGMTRADSSIEMRPSTLVSSRDCPSVAESRSSETSRDSACQSSSSSEYYNFTRTCHNLTRTSPQNVIGTRKLFSLNTAVKIETVCVLWTTISKRRLKRRTEKCKQVPTTLTSNRVDRKMIFLWAIWVT